MIVIGRKIHWQDGNTSWSRIIQLQRPKREHNSFSVEIKSLRGGKYN